MNKIGIIGLGLIGGSLAKAFKQKSSTHIVAMDLNHESLESAKSQGVIDEYTCKINECFKDCEIIFLCTPIKYIIGYIEELLPYISSECIITDVGSTKKAVIHEMYKYSQHFCFIGGHPMAGSEKIGYTASRSHLFENAYYILSPLENIDATKVQLLQNMIQGIGAIPVILDPETHDLITAAISHVPHIVASSMVNMVRTLDTQNHSMQKLAAGGFKDITRIASSSPDMWSHICMTNQKEILHVMDVLKNALNQFESAIKESREKDLWDCFKEAKDYRDSFTSRSPGPFAKFFEVIVDVVDRPGIIAEIATLLSNHHINIKNIGIINNREFENGVLQIIVEDEKSQLESVSLLERMNFTVYIKS